MCYSLPALLVATTLVASGCGKPQVSLQERVLPHANPTSYEFDDATINDVKSAIKMAFEKWRDEELKNRKERIWKGSGDADAKRLLTMQLQLPPASLIWKGDADALSKHLLTKTGNENDAYFYGTDSPVGESLVYPKDGQPLIYFADFHIHLAAVDPRKTRVEIFTYDSSVNTGAKGPRSAHGRTFLFVPVAPTTVEEYQILLRIGEQIGVKGMPRPVIPAPDSPVRELTKRWEH
jgi:hypothetical protein